MLGIEAACPEKYKQSEECLALIEEVKKEQIAKIEEKKTEKEFKPPEIQSAAPSRVVVDETDNTNDITGSLKDMWGTLKTFTEMIEGAMPEIEAKFGLSNETPLPIEQSPSVKFTKEDRIEDAKLNKMAK